jgi:hypothetical protein
MIEQRIFPLADVLSVTTGRLLSRRKMEGVCDCIVWLTRTARFPRFMSQQTCARLIVTAAAAKRQILAQHPWLAELQPPADPDPADLYSWLLTAETTHGENITLTRDSPALSPAAAIAAFAKTVGAATKATVELIDALNIPIEGD